MIINQLGAVFEYDGEKYIIGEPIVGSEESEYMGLFGIITEIRDGEDKDTENDTPDFYCSFDPPILPWDIKMLEGIFSDLYDQPKTLDDIILDSVIMAPSMVTPVCSVKRNQKELTVYTVREEWSIKGKNDETVVQFTTYNDAKQEFYIRLKEEQESGCIHDWLDDPKFSIELEDDAYKCWLEDEFFENHYVLSISTDTIYMSPSTFGELGREYVDNVYREDFASHVASWDDVTKMSDRQRRFFLSDPYIPDRINKALGRNDSYWESYWETISEVAHDVLRKHLPWFVFDECYTPVPDVPFPECEGKHLDKCKSCHLRSFVKKEEE